MVALLCLSIFCETKHETLKWLAQSEPIPDELLAALLSADPTRPAIAAALAEQPPAFVARLALLCLLRTEAETSAHLRHPARLAEWLTEAAADGNTVGERLASLLQPEAA